MPHKALPCDLRIRVTVAEPDLRDALLVLYCYSCSDYEIAHGDGDSCRPIAAPTDDAVLTRVVIYASCKAAAGPALLEELAAAFGKTDAFDAAMESD